MAIDVAKDSYTPVMPARGASLVVSRCGLSVCRSVNQMSYERPENALILICDNSLLSTHYGLRS